MLSRIAAMIRIAPSRKFDTSLSAIVSSSAVPCDHKVPSRGSPAV
jgi:hypothetical protein